MNAAGAIQQEGRVQTNEASLRGLLEGKARACVVLEVGTHSPWISRQIHQMGHEAIVANPRRVRLIWGESDKSDRLDAEHLARLGRVDPELLKPIQHRGQQAQQDLALIRSRDILVRTRTRLVVHARGSVKAMGGRLPKCTTSSFATKVAGHVPERLNAALGPVIEQIAQLSQQIRAYDRSIERLCQQRYPETARVQQPSGVGALTALAFVLVLEDPDRFRTSRAVGAYLGLRPRQRQSGDCRQQLGITKCGDIMLRRLLVGSAQYILGPFGPDCDLRRWGLGLAARGGANAKKRAAVAVARKLAVLMHRLWISAQVYEPLRNNPQPQQVAEAC
jgi:transposase